MLEKGEGRPALGIERHDFAVEDRGGEIELIQGLDGLRELLVDGMAAPAADGYLPLGAGAAQVGEGADAVPLDLKQPVCPIEWLLDQRRERWFDLFRKRIASRRIELEGLQLPPGRW